MFKKIVKIPNHQNNLLFKNILELNRLFSLCKFKIKFSDKEVIETTGNNWYKHDTSMMYDEQYVVILNSDLINIISEMSVPISMRI